MVLKILGSIMVIASTTTIGFLKASELKMRLTSLSEIKNTLILFENEISFTKSPLNEIFKKLSKTGDEWIVKVLRKVVETLESNSGTPASIAWQDAVLSLSEGFLKNDDIKIILDFGKCLGSTDLEGQINNLKSVISSLDKQIEKAAAFRDKNQKLYKSLGIYSGILTAILFF